MFEDDHPNLEPVYGMSQLVISEQAFTCMINQMAKSNLGRFVITPEYFDKKVNLPWMKLDTSLFKSVLGIGLFADKIGDGIPLTIDLRFKDLDILLGTEKANMNFVYTEALTIHRADTNEIIFTDQYRVRSLLNLQTDSDVLHFNLTELTLIEDSKHNMKRLPLYNSLNITANEYVAYMDSLSNSYHVKQELFNDMVFKGDKMKFPFTMKELETIIEFGPQQMYVLLKVENDVETFLEDEFW